MSPAGTFPFASEFYGHCPKDKNHQQEHKSGIETGEYCGIDMGECREQCPATGHQPYFVSIPHRSDGV